MAQVAIPQKHVAGLAALFVLVLASPSEAAQLSAADFDDNLNFSYYLDYERSPFSGASAAGMPNLSFEDRVTIRLTDQDGRPASNAVVEFTPQPQQGDVIRLIAGTDGVVRFFPTFDGDGNATSFTMDVIWPGEEGAAISASLNMATLNSARDYTLKVQNRTAALPTSLDVMFLIDTTGSMGDEIAYLRSEFANITAALAADHPNLDTRFGLVVYRDEGDEYVARSLGFTADTSVMQGWLRGLAADGGGDMPEAMDVGLRTAVAEEWRDGNTARVMFLVADAPPHQAGYKPFIEAAGEARRSGIHIFPVAASGTERYAQYLMRAAEVLTQGRYIFLTDDSGIGNPHETPIIPCYVVTPLAGLMTRVVGGEITGARIEPPAEAIIRTVGNYSAGQCVEQGQIARPASGTLDGTQPEPEEPAPVEPEEPAAPPKVTTTDSPPEAEGSLDVTTATAGSSSGTSSGSTGAYSSSTTVGPSTTGVHTEASSSAVPSAPTYASPEMSEDSIDTLRVVVPPAPTTDSAAALGGTGGSALMGLIGLLAGAAVGLSALALRQRRRK